MQKATLRATALAARDALSGERRAAAAQAIALRGLPFEIMPGKYSETAVRPVLPTTSPTKRMRKSTTPEIEHLCFR